MTNFRGLSLIEVLIGVIIFGVGGAILVATMISSNDVFISQTAQVNQGLSINQTASKIEETIKYSAGVNLQYPPTGNAQFVSANNSIVLKIPSVDQNGMILDSVFDYVVWHIDSANPQILRKQVFITSPSARNPENQVLSTSLKELQFRYFDANNNIVAPAQAVRVGFIVNLLEEGSSNESSVSGTINIKNL